MSAPRSRHRGRLPETAQAGFAELLSVPPEGSTPTKASALFVADDPHRLFVGPQRLAHYLEGNDLGWVVALRAEVERMDWSDFVSAYQSTGRRPFHPRVVLGLVVYGLFLGVRKMRELEMLAIRDVGAWFICGGLQPDHSTICKFLLRHEKVLTETFFQTQTKRLFERLGMKPAVLAIDGTVVEAASSLHRTLSQEAASLAAQEAREQFEAAKAKSDQSESVAQASQTVGHASPPGAETAPQMPSAAESAQPPGAQPNSPTGAIGKLADEVERLETVAAAAEYRAAKLEAQGKPSDHVRVSPTEADAVVQPRKDGAIRPSYKPAVGTTADGLIAAQHVDPSSETNALEPLLNQHERVLGAKPTAVLADAGFNSVDGLAVFVARDIDALVPSGQAFDEQSLAKKGSGGLFAKSQFAYLEAEDAYRCPAGCLLTVKSRETDWQGRHSRRYATRACHGCPLKAQCTKGAKRTIKRYEGEELKEAMAMVLSQPAARDLYRKRMSMVEPAFAALKGKFGLTRFLRKGLRKVRVDFAIACVAFNLWKAQRIVARVEVVVALIRHRGAPLLAMVAVTIRPPRRT